MYWKGEDSFLTPYVTAPPVDLASHTASKSPVIKVVSRYTASKVVEIVVPLSSMVNWLPVPLLAHEPLGFGSVIPSSTKRQSKTSYVSCKNLRKLTLEKLP